MFQFEDGILYKLQTTDQRNKQINRNVERFFILYCAVHIKCIFLKSFKEVELYENLYYKKLFSGHDMALELMNTPQLWFPAQDSIRLVPSTCLQR